MSEKPNQVQSWTSTDDPGRRDISNRKPAPDGQADMPGLRGRRPAIPGTEAPLSPDARTVLYAVRRRWWLILIATLVGIALSLASARAAYTTTYTTKVLFYVDNVSVEPGDVKPYITVSDINAAQRLAEIYGVVLRSRDLLQSVDQALVSCTDGRHYELGYARLNAMLSCGTVGDTPILCVYVTGRTAGESYDVARALAGVLPTRLTETVVGSSVSLVDSGFLPVTDPPDLLSRGAVGAVIGALTAILWATAAAVFRERISRPERLRECFPELPVLTVVPAGHAKKKKEGGRRHRVQT